MSLLKYFSWHMDNYKVWSEIWKNGCDCVQNVLGTAWFSQRWMQAAACCVHGVTEHSPAHANRTHFKPKHRVIKQIKPWSVHIKRIWFYSELLQHCSRMFLNVPLSAKDKHSVGNFYFIKSKCSSKFACM